MTDSERFTHLLSEFRRVGVDPDTFSAVLTITPDEALRVLGELEDDAGPAAFLARLRRDRDERSPLAASAELPDLAS